MSDGRCEIKKERESEEEKGKEIYRTLFNSLPSKELRRRKMVKMELLLHAVQSG